MSVSVVIPAYNSARFISEAIESVLKQTVLADEIIVIDDGSTDETALIAESFGPPVRVFRRPNSKQAASRNFGVREATSEWIAFLDADDVWEPNKLKLQLEELSKNPAADVCYTGRVEFEDNGGKPRFGKVISVAKPENIRKALFRNTNFLPSSVIVRRSLYLSVGGFDPHFVVVQDWDLWLRLLHAGATFVACPEPLVHYRLHAHSVTSGNGLAALHAKDEIYCRHIFPHLSWSTRWFTRNKIRSEHEFCAAFVLREADDSRDLRLMFRSVLRAPFYFPHRYKVLAHMMLVRFIATAARSVVVNKNRAS